DLLLPLSFLRPPPPPSSPLFPYTTLFRSTQRYRLHTTDDERARVVCLNQSGLRDLIVEGDGALLFSAEEPAVAELSHALVGAGRSEERRVGKGGGAGGGGAGEGDDEG